MLRPRREVEAAQRRVGVIAGRLENMVEEIEDWPLERRHLGREAIEQHAVARRRFLLEPVGEFAVQALDKVVELFRYVADEVAGLVVGLERRAPDLAAALVGLTCEILGEARNQVSLGEQRVDREIDLETLMQFK